MAVRTLPQTRTLRATSSGSAVVAGPRHMAGALPPAQAMLKRGTDLLMALGALVVLAPVFAAVALAIRLDSRGPVLFRQRRVGHMDQGFAMFKFRTMFEGAHALRQELGALNEAQGGLFKISEDPRVTRVGRVLRRTHLDELPQLINVLLGTMSIVGPRPLVPEEDLLVPLSLRGRLSVRPGITGPWQVGLGHDLGVAGMAEVDLDYIARWTPLADLRLLGQTVAHVAARRGK